MPFFVASKNVINDITSTLSKSMSSLKLFRFAEKHENEMRSYFPIFMHEYDQKKDNLTLNLDSNDFISNTSEKTIIESPRFIEDNNDKDEDLNNLTNDNINNDPNDISSIDKYELKENLNKNKTVYAISNVLSPEICEDLWKKYPYLDFGCDRIPVSFLQIKSKLRFKI